MVETTMVVAGGVKHLSSQHQGESRRNAVI